MSLKCSCCGGSLVETTVDFDAHWRGRSVTFRGLPAARCETCGHLLFTPTTVDLMSDFIDAKLNIGESLPEVLTADEAARYLRVSPQTVYSLAKAGELPGSKVGGQLRFLKSALADLLKPQAAPPIAAAFRGKPAPEDLQTLREVLKEERQGDEPKG